MLTFPRLLEFFPLVLNSALTKMGAASNDGLIQRTLHPPKIPRKSLAGPSKAGSLSASSADHGGVSPVVPRSQQQALTNPSSSSSQHGWKRRSKGKTPFQGSPADPAAPKVNEKGPGKSCPDGISPLLRVGVVYRCTGGTGSQLKRAPGCLSVLRDGYRIPFLDSPPPLSRTPISFPTHRA